MFSIKYPLQYRFCFKIFQIFLKNSFKDSCLVLYYRIVKQKKKKDDPYFMSFIAVTDYKMGNLLNVSKALKAVGAEIRIAAKPEDVRGASGMVLPGVGNFGEAMEHLQESGFIPLIKTWIAEDRPFLGICLGMQMLMESSEEAPGVAGIGVFPGTVKRFPGGREKIPHMGWNTVDVRNNNDFLNGLPRDPSFYFVHSYYVETDCNEIIAAT